MTLVRLENLFLRFGDRPLLVNTSLAIDEHERICLIGRNGAGKSTLMNIIAGELKPDEGEIHYRDHLRISQLEQALPGELHRVVHDVIEEGLADQRARILAYKEKSTQDLDDNGIKALAALQAAIESGGGWNIEQQIETIVSQLELPMHKKLEELSGGWRRRVMLGKALVCNPDLLLLDEPTNHLDISTIEWLEHKVRGFAGTVIFITHDRDFLRKLATRIIDVDRGRVTSWPGTFDNYLKLKAEANETEDTANALFDKRLEQEEAWIRQGVKARRTRNEGRVRSLYAMRDEGEQRQKREGKAKFYVESGDPSGRKVIEAYKVNHAFEGQPLIKNFSIKIKRGDRIGIIGNNGVGKSTLLRILLGEITPDSGSIKLGTNLQIGYFDQIRRELDPERTVASIIGDGKDYIIVNDKERHVIGYMRNFLFAPERSMTKIKSLSGGECNRVLLARLFTRPSNLLILDEPTNDLDVEMLEVLEEQLGEYEGTLLIVSHDRQFLDNVVDRILVFEQDGGLKEYVGGYSDWVKRGLELKISEQESLKAQGLAGAHHVGAGLVPAQNNDKQGQPQGLPLQTKPNKLSYKLQRELDMLPQQIDELEVAKNILEEQTADPDFYNQPFEVTEPVLQALSDKHWEIHRATERWMELQEMADGSS